MDDNIYVVPYFPRGVQYIITTGSNHYIGYVDESTVLKYPHFRGSLESLRVERIILEWLGTHSRIIAFKGWHDDGVLLEYAVTGSLENYLKKNTVTTKERLRFAREIAEGVSHVHRRNVLVCDIHVRNILLDSELHVKLCDFQGRLLGSNGEILLSGGASENAESFKPRPDTGHADFITDIFALGSTIYHVMTGHRPFLEYDTIDDEGKIASLYRNGHFPALADNLGGDITRKCWSGVYKSVDEVGKDLHNLEQLV